MQDGIGRAGYRVLALVFFAVAGVGLVTATAALEPSGFSEWLGFGLTGAFLVALCALAMVGLGSATARAGVHAEPAGAPLAAARSADTEPAGATDPSADLGMDYGDFEPVPPEPAEPGPPRIQPPPVPVVQPRRTVPGKGWPERRDPAGWTRRQVHERNLPRDPGPDIEVEGPGPVKREAHIVMARTVASAEASGIPEGTGIGKCSNCGTLLLAPKRRPLRLQCPRCERVHTLA